MWPMVTIGIMLLLPVQHVVAQTIPPTSKESTSEQMFTLQQQSARLAIRVDSLTESLRQHRYAENFMVSELDRATTIFAVIVTVVIALFGALTWSDFRNRVQRSEQKQGENLTRETAEQQRKLNDALATQQKKLDDALATQQKKLDDALADLHSTEGTLTNNLETATLEWEEARRVVRRAAGNAYMALASLGERSSGSTLATWLLASANFYAADNPVGDRTNKVAAECLEEALATLAEIGSLEPHKIEEEMAREPARVREAVKMLSVHIDQPEVCKWFAQVYVGLGKLGFDLSEIGIRVTPGPGVIGLS